MEKRRIAILGSTGSVGQQALSVIREQSQLLEATLLVAHSNYKLLAEQAIQFEVNSVIIIDERYYEALNELLTQTDIKVFGGRGSLLDFLESDSIDMVLNAIVGFAGLAASLRCISLRKPLALANKESIVVAGELIMKEIRQFQSPLIPVDSEPSAIFQCMKGEQFSDIKRIYLTASGGPFLNFPVDALKKVTPEQALKHPNWKMGPKISIDSAGLMNKGFEVIEAFWLFNLKPEQIDVLIHPSSVVHSMVQLTDGSLKAHAAYPDMKIQIQYALAYPMRPSNSFPTIDFSRPTQWDFSPTRKEDYPNLQLAYQVLDKQGNTGCTLNAANEIAVDAFLKHRIAFTDIPRINEQTLNQMPFIPNPGLEELIQTDKEARIIAESLL